MAIHTATGNAAVPLLSQHQQLAKTIPCRSGRRVHYQRQRQTYDIIKQCRQCRRQIRTADDEYDQDFDDDDDDVKYCECLLGAQSTDGKHVNDDDGDYDDTDEYGDDDDDANDVGQVECKPQRDHRAERRLCEAKLGKPIRATETAASSSTSCATDDEWLLNIAANAVSAQPTAAVVTRCVKGVGVAVDADGDDGDDAEGDDNDTDDLHARLVNEKLDGRPTLMDNSGLPSYDAAAKLRPMCGRLN